MVFKKDGITTELRFEQPYSHGHKLAVALTPCGNGENWTEITFDKISGRQSARLNGTLNLQNLEQLASALLEAAKTIRHRQENPKLEVKS